MPNLRQNPLKYLLVPFFLFSQAATIFKLLRKGDYDIIHAHWIIPQGLTAGIALGLLRQRVPLVLTSHGGDLFSLSGSLLSRLKRRTTRSADKLTVVSSAMRRNASEAGLKSVSEIDVIPMGVDSQDTFLPPDDNVKREGLLFVGRLVDKKGIEYVIDAMPTILQRHPAIELTIVGDGPLREALEQRCRQQGVEDNVRFLGARPNHEIPDFLRKCEICVFPSIVTDSGDQEGTPVAIMEALSCECAAIVSDYPGARDIIKHGDTGLLVSQRASKEIAEGVIQLLGDPALRQRLGKNGRLFVRQHYDWRIISGKFSDTFRALTGK